MYFERTPRKVTGPCASDCLTATVKLETLAARLDAEVQKPPPSNNN